MGDYKFKSYLKQVLVSFAVAAVVSVLLINYVISAYRIEGDSMYPALEHGQRILISKIAVNGENLHRFDIVVLAKPNEPSKSIIKRIIGLPGETVEIKEGDVFIDGKKLYQPSLGKEKGLIYKSGNLKPRFVPKGHYFVLGDNRRVSLDSRAFGVVPEENIFGKAFFRYWPFSKFGKIE